MSSVCCPIADGTQFRCFTPGSILPPDPGGCSAGTPVPELSDAEATLLIPSPEDRRNLYKKSFFSIQSHFVLLVVPCLAPGFHSRKFDYG